LKVAQVKKSQLPVMVDFIKDPMADAHLPEKLNEKERLNNQFLAPNMKSSKNKNWLNELIPESTEDLPKPSDITCKNIF
jgi:hypothetical protein